MHVRLIEGAKQLSVVNNNQVYLGAGNSAVRDKSVGVDVGRQTNNGGNGWNRHHYLNSPRKKRTEI